MDRGFGTNLTLWAVLAFILASPVDAEEPVLIFRGEVGGRTLRAYSVPAASDSAALADLVERPDLVIVVYEDYEEATSVEPSVMFSGDQVKIFNERPAREVATPTIGELIRAANLAGPKKLGVVCRDGTRPVLSGRSQLTQLVSAWKSCARRGGVGRSFHTTTRDLDAVIATICDDYRLVAGNGDACASSSPLAKVRNHNY